MKHTLYRLTETSKVPFFKGTQAQCLWKLLRHVVNCSTVQVDTLLATDWINSLNVKSFKLKTSVTGFTIFFRGRGTKDILRNIKRAELKFATSF